MSPSHLNRSPYSGTAGALRQPALGLVPRQLPWPLWCLKVALTGPGTCLRFALGCNHAFWFRLSGGCGVSQRNPHLCAQHRGRSLRGARFHVRPSAGYTRACTGCGGEEQPRSACSFLFVFCPDELTQSHRVARTTSVPMSKCPVV